MRARLARCALERWSNIAILPPETEMGYGAGLDAITNQANVQLRI